AAVLEPELVVLVHDGILLFLLFLLLFFYLFLPLVFVFFKSHFPPLFLLLYLLLILTLGIGLLVFGRRDLLADFGPVDNHDSVVDLGGHITERGSTNFATIAIDIHADNCPAAPLRVDQCLHLTVVQSPPLLRRLRVFIGLDITYEQQPMGTLFPNPPFAQLRRKAGQSAVVDSFAAHGFRFDVV